MRLTRSLSVLCSAKVPGNRNDPQVSMLGLFRWLVIESMTIGMPEVRLVDSSDHGSPICLLLVRWIGLDDTARLLMEE